MTSPLHMDQQLVAEGAAASAADHTAAAVCLCQVSPDTLDRTAALASAAVLRVHWKV